MVSRYWKSYFNVLIYIFLIIIILITLFPFYWTFMSSFKNYAEMFRIPPTLYPKLFTLNNYIDVYHGSFFYCIRNSLIIALVSMLISVIIGVPAAYSFARLKSSWFMVIFFIILAIRMFPSVSFMLPMYLMFRALGFYNTRLAVIASHLTWQLPFVIWMLEGYIRDIPNELEEAARIDGCSRWSAMLKVILPLAAPGLSVAGIFAFIMSWNEFPFALVLTSTTSAKTATVNIAETITSYQIFWGQMTASGTIFVLPVLIFSLFIQKYLIKALISGAVKG